MKNPSVPQAASRRNNEQHHAIPDFRNLTPAGRVIFRLTHRPASTCNLLAKLAGLDRGEAQ